MCPSCLHPLLVYLHVLFKGVFISSLGSSDLHHNNPSMAHSHNLKEMRKKTKKNTNKKHDNRSSCVGLSRSSAIAGEACLWGSSLDDAEDVSAPKSGGRLNRLSRHNIPNMSSGQKICLQIRKNCSYIQKICFQSGKQDLVRHRPWEGHNKVLNEGSQGPSWFHLAPSVKAFAMKAAFPLQGAIIKPVIPIQCTEISQSSPSIWAQSQRSRSLSRVPEHICGEDVSQNTEDKKFR